MFDICDEHVKRHVYNKSDDDRYYNMLKRCYDEKHKDYGDYGGRGITVCEEWRENKGVFMRWCRDIKREKGMELDRRDNDKGYSPENCRFVTKKENRNNRRDSKGTDK